MVQFPSFLILAGLFIDVIAATSITNTPIGTLHRRSYFYVGGELNQLGNVTTETGQLYVEHLTPARVTQHLPILFIHGRGMTGTNFLNTPDGRLGWADHFMSRGFQVYIVDQTERGRSSWINGIDGVQDAPDTFTIESRFTATQRFNIWPQASLHTQWHGNGSVGDPTFDNFFSSVMPSLVSEAESSERMRVAGSKLLDEIGPVILLTHSQAGQYGWILGDARPSLVKAIVAVEPIGPPFQNAIFTTDPARLFGVTEIPLTFSPPISSASDLLPVVVETEANFTCFEQARPARKLSNLAKVPVLVITSQSSYHAVYDECSVHFLRQAGVQVQHVPLESVGIMGNGHMMFLEKNNLQIADEVILNWIQHTVSL